MNISIKGFITCKGAESYSDCADYYSHNLNNHKFSISDGVSKSFFPKFWSRALANTFVDSAFDKENLVEKAQQIWQTQVDEIVKEPDVKWFTKAAYNRKTPGLATFVGLQFIESESKWKASAIGDSFLFFVPKYFKDFEKDITKLSSKADPLIFDNFPDYLSSVGNDHKGTIHTIEQDFQDGNFYLMTDALAEWFINQKEKALKTIDAWKSQTEFEDFVSTQRKNGNLGDDDSAIFILNTHNSSDRGIAYSSIEIRDLDQLINHQEAELQKNKELQENSSEVENRSEISQDYEPSSEKIDELIPVNQEAQRQQKSNATNSETLKEQIKVKQQEQILSGQEKAERSPKEEEEEELAYEQLEKKLEKKGDNQIIQKHANIFSHEQGVHDTFKNQYQQELHPILEEQRNFSKSLDETLKDGDSCEEIINPTISDDTKLEKQEIVKLCTTVEEKFEAKEGSKAINTVASLITNKF